MKDSMYKRRKVVAERVTALQKDGFVVTNRSLSYYWGMWKLVHISNHKRISIVADFENNHMTQRTNDKLVFNGLILPQE